MTTERSAMEELYNQSIKILKEGQIVRGKIVSVKTKEILVDVGFKSEGVVPIIQFGKEELAVGRELDFFIECIEDDSGMIGLSRDKAVRIQGWDKIVKNANEGTLVEGKPIKKVKGGFLVDVVGIEGFLPTSLSSFKGLLDKNILYNTFKFKIIKVNNVRHSIILSHREAMQKAKEEAKVKLWQDLKVGGICSGLVKAITDLARLWTWAALTGFYISPICPGLKSAILPR